MQSLPNYATAMHRLCSGWLALLALTVLLAGCGGDTGSGSPGENGATPVFRPFSLPATMAGAGAYLQGLEEEAEALVKKVKAAAEPRWDNTVIPLREAANLLDEAKYSAALLQSGAADPDLRAAAAEWYPQTENLIDELFSDPELYRQYSIAMETLSRELSPAERLDAQSLFVDMRRLVDPDGVAEYLQNRQQLVDVSYQFYLNTQSAPYPEAAYTPEELACLPETFLARLPVDDQGRYLSTGSPLGALLVSCLPEAVRDRMLASQSSRAFAENQPLLPQMLQSRHVYAQQLGHADYASAELEHNLLNTPAQVANFLDDFADATAGPFRKLTDGYRQMQAEETGIWPATLSLGNYLRYALLEGKQQSQQPAELRGDYLEHEQTMANLLVLFGQLFGLRFETLVAEAPFWAPTVTGYRVFDVDTEQPVGTLLYQPFGRETRTLLLHRRQSLADGTELTPTLVLSLALQPPTADDPVYLSPDQLTSLGHEMGHVLQNLLARRNYEILNFDFQEVPSMFMDRLMRQEAVLRALLSADPLRPSASLPADFRDWWYSQTREGRQELSDLRYYLAVSRTFLDLATWRPGQSTALGAMGRDNLAASYFPYPAAAEPFYDFPHLVQPGYATSFYLYLLGDALAFDLLERMLPGASGEVSPAAAREFRRTILETGAFDPQAKLREFLGHDLRLDALAEHYQELAGQW